MMDLAECCCPLREKASMRPMMAAITNRKKKAAVRFVLSIFLSLSIKIDRADGRKFILLLESAKRKKKTG